MLMASQVCPMLLYFGGTVSFNLAFDNEQRIGRPRTTKMDENIARVTAVLNEHRSAGGGLVGMLTGITKTIV